MKKRIVYVETTDRFFDYSKLENKYSKYTVIAVYYRDSNYDKEQVVFI
jgi:hypothetical protein